MKKGQRGFTLIELLVVIAIIALLSSIILASLNTARGKGRNAKRQDDIHQYQIAFELYYDKYGYYPPTGNGTGFVCLGQPSSGTCWTGGLTNGDDTLLGNTNQFLQSPVGDSVAGVSGYVYRCISLVGTCSKYELKWNLEGTGQKCNNGATPSGTTNTQCDYNSQ